MLILHGAVIQIKLGMVSGFHSYFFLKDYRALLSFMSFIIDIPILLQNDQSSHGKEAEDKKVIPHFWNLNEDPALTGMIVHFANSGKTLLKNIDAIVKA